MCFRFPRFTVVNLLPVQRGQFSVFLIVFPGVKKLRKNKKTTSSLKFRLSLFPRGFENNDPLGT